MSPEAANISPNPAQTGWNYRDLAAAWAIGLILQLLVLPCLCQLGTAKVLFALIFDALILVRMWIAYLKNETGRGWIAYAVLCGTSAGWIELLTYLVFGDT